MWETLENSGNVWVRFIQNQIHEGLHECMHTHFSFHYRIIKTAGVLSRNHNKVIIAHDVTAQTAVSHRPFSTESTND